MFARPPHAERLRLGRDRAGDPYLPIIPSFAAHLHAEPESRPAVPPPRGSCDRFGNPRAMPRIAPTSAPRCLVMTRAWVTTAGAGARPQSRFVADGEVASLSGGPRVNDCAVHVVESTQITRPAARRASSSPRGIARPRCTGYRCDARARETRRNPVGKKPSMPVRLKYPWLHATSRR